GLGHVFHAVGDDEIKAVVREHRLGEFREVLLGELDHRGVDLDLSETLNRLMLEHLLRDAAVAAADDQHLLRMAVRQDRHMGHHLVVDELILAGDLRRAVEHQHLAEERVLEQHEMLVRGLQLVDHPLDLVGHADTDVIEQRLGNPAFFGHDRTSETAGGRHRKERKSPTVRRRLCSDYVSCPRKISLTSTRLALKAFRSTGMQASGVALPHMNRSRAATRGSGHVWIGMWLPASPATPDTPFGWKWCRWMCSSVACAASTQRRSVASIRLMSLSPSAPCRSTIRCTPAQRTPLRTAKCPSRPSAEEALTTAT